MNSKQRRQQQRSSTDGSFPLRASVSPGSPAAPDSPKPPDPPSPGARAHAGAGRFSVQADGDKFTVTSGDGKQLGTFETQAAADARWTRVQFVAAALPDLAGEGCGSVADWLTNSALYGVPNLREPGNEQGLLDYLRSEYTRRKSESDASGGAMPAPVWMLQDARDALYGKPGITDPDSIVAWLYGEAPPEIAGEPAISMPPATASATQPVPIAASRRIRCSKPQISGGPLDAEGIRWPITLVKAGPALLLGPTKKQGYVPADTIEKAVKANVFADSYLNHPTPEEEIALPERDAAKKIGVLSDVTYDAKAEAAVGVWHCYDATLRARLLDAHKDGRLGDFLDFSIYGPCDWAVKTIDGKEYDVVTAIQSASADLVTDGAAGGAFRLAASLRGEGIPMKWSAFLKARAAVASTLLAAASDEAAVQAVDELGFTFTADATRDQFVTDLKAARKMVRAAELPPPAAAAVVPPVTPPPVEKVAAAQVACPGCGTMNAADAKYCDQCGAAMTPVSAAKVEPPPNVVPPAVTAALEEAKAMVAAARADADLLRAASRDRHIESRLVGFDVVDREFLNGEKGQLRAAKSIEEIDQIVERHRGYLAAARASDNGMGFPTGRVSGDVAAGADVWDTYIAGLDGLIRGVDVTPEGGKKVARFANIMQAVENCPSFRGSRSSGWRGGSLTYADKVEAWSQLGAWYKGSGDEGYVLRGSQKVNIRAAITSATFGEVFADRLYRSAMSYWSAPDSLAEVLELASKVIEVDDFQTHRLTVVGGYGDASVVLEGATYPMSTSPTDAEETFALYKIGGLESITLEAFLNPDSDKLLELPKRLATSIRRTARKAVIAAFTTANPTMNQDGVALYHSTHGNTGTAEFTVSSASAVRTAMLKQTERDSGERLGEICEPAAILFPADIADRVEAACMGSDGVNTNVAVLGTDQFLDPRTAWLRRVKRIMVPHWTDVNNHYYVADKNKIDTFAVARMRGVKDVEIFTQDSEDSPSMFNADKRMLKGRFMIAVAPLTYQAFYSQIVSG